MDVSLLSFTPKLTEKKKDPSLKTISSKLVFQSPRRRRKQNVLPLRDICSSPSNLQNIAKNENLSCRNSNNLVNGSIYSPFINKSKVKFDLGETVVLESSDTDNSTCSLRKRNSTKAKLIETIVIESSDSEEFISDSQPSIPPQFATLSGKSNTGIIKDDGDKLKEIEHFLDELQEFTYKRHSSGMSPVSPGNEADESKNTSETSLQNLKEEIITTKSNINSMQGAKGERKKANAEQVKGKTPDDSCDSSSKHFKKMLKQGNKHVQKPKNGQSNNATQQASPYRGDEIGKMDKEKFKNIVQWLDKVEPPVLNKMPVRAAGKESDNENSFVHSVRRPVYRHNVIVSDSESGNSSSRSSESSSKKRRSDSGDRSSCDSIGKKQILSCDSDSSSSTSLIISKKKKSQLQRYDSESSSDESKTDAGLILIPKYSPWRKREDEGSSKSSSTHKKSDENDDSSELSVVSATSMDRLLSNIYGDTWDKETVLTPAVKKIQSGKQKMRIPLTVPRVLKDNRLKDPPSTKGKQKVPVPTFNLSRKQLYFSDQENIPTPPSQLVPKLQRTPKTSKIPRTPATGFTSPQPIITLGFLRSLSVSPPSAQCNVKALYYKKDFKSKKEALTAELFAHYNKVVFENKLPSDMRVEWNARLNRTAGFCYNSSVLRPDGRLRISRIELATKVCTSPDRVRDTLIHEMCHAAVWVVDGVKGGHGPQWKAWARKSMKKLPELPPIGRCHQYKIETKYTYRCKSCGYSIGRHSKSLDLSRKRCGLCYGEFELLVNTKSRKADAPAVVTPRTPRVATGFALYVKENYKTVREEKKDLKHAEIMKLLGTKFAALKMQTNN